MFTMNPISELPEAPPEFTSAAADAAAELIRLALAEDLGEAGDRTGEALIEQDAVGRVEIRSRGDGTVCGLPVVRQLFETLDTRVTVAAHVRDGQRIGEPGCLATLAGPVRSLLAGERTALNFLGHPPGIATQVAAHVAAVAGTRESAARLSQYLVLNNSLVEGGGSYDELVVLALVEALGALGDNIATDGLIYISHLNYSSEVKSAARQAFDNLKF